jgi:hypothetical protein
MKWLIAVTTLVFIGDIVHSENSGRPKIDPTVYVDFKSPEGIKRLDRAKYKLVFFYLANNFEPQEVTPYGGPATAAVVMNTLRPPDSKIERPVDNTKLTKEELSVMPKGYNPFFKKFTQQNIFIPGVKDKLVVLGKPVNDKEDVGFQLRQLHELFRAHKFNSEIHVADNSWNLRKLRAEFKTYLNDPSHVIVANYRRDEMGQGRKNGHLSPVAAYDEKSDSFLIMDVNPNISHWGWVKASALLKAMQTFDTSENRGYLVVSE